MSSNSQSLSVLATNNAWSSDVISDGYAYLHRDKIVVVVELYWAKTLTVDKCRCIVKQINASLWWHGSST